MNSERFTIPEYFLILIGATLFTLCTTIYVTDYPLGRVLFGWDFSSNLVPVGKLALDGGDTKRKLDNQSAFRTVEKNSVLFNFDTIVTGPESPAQVEFDDGTIIELAPKTMIRLSFEERLGITGINRAATVNIVSGKVKGSVKPKVAGSVTPRTVILKTRQKKVTLTPQPLPKPIELAAIPQVRVAPPIPTKIEKVIEQAKPEVSKSITQRQEQTEQKALPKATRPQVVIRSPKNAARLVIPKGSPIDKKKVIFQWKVSPRKTPHEVRLEKIGKSGKTTKLLSRKFRSSPPKEKPFSVILEQPGTYQWSITSLGEYPFQEPGLSRFKIEPEFEGIRLMPSLFGGKKLKSTRLSENDVIQDFDIRLRWKKFPGAKRYVIRFYKTSTSKKSIWERTTPGNYVILNKKKVFDGKTYFQVTSDLPSGFVATSTKTAFKFDFLPPIPVLPKNGTILPPKKNPKENGLIFTWEKTHFTEAYELQVTRDKSFEGDFAIDTVRKENFFISNGLEPGIYFWRVRSISQDLKSPPSAIYKLVVK